MFTRWIIFVAILLVFPNFTESRLSDLKFVAMLADFRMRNITHAA